MKSFSLRVQDVETDDNFNPVTGLEEVPLVGLADALHHAQETDKQLRGLNLTLNRQCALKFGRMQAKQAGEVLSVDEIAAIHLYTQESPFYRLLNERLRERDRTKLKPLTLFLKLLLSGLYKLPPVSDINLYRWVKRDLSGRFREGDEKTLWAVSSCTAKLKVLENDMFLGKTGHRTLFHIVTTCAFNISAYSAMPKEDEYVLAPNSEVEVESVLDAGNGLVMVQLKQLPYHHLFPPPLPPPPPPQAAAAAAQPGKAPVQFDKSDASAVVGAMATHHTNHDVQLRGCKALAEIAHVEEANRVAVARAGGIEAVITAMRTHLSHADVQHYGCWALKNIAIHSDNRVAVERAGGIEAVITAMHTHPSHADVQHRGCVALTCFGENNAKLCQQIMAAGGQDVVTQAVSLHDGHTGVQDGAKKFLAMLSK
jgi:hypothetical protein